MPPAAVAAAPPEAGQPAHLYLDNFLDSVESLPQELQRNFMLMRQLDTRTQELMAKIERSTRDVLKRRENLTEQRTVSCLDCTPTEMSARHMTPAHSSLLAAAGDHA